MFEKLNLSLLSKDEFVDIDSPSGHYLVLDGDAAEILAVNCFQGTDAYRGFLRGFEVTAVWKTPGSGEGGDQVVSIFLRRGT